MKESAKKDYSEISRDASVVIGNWDFSAQQSPITESAGKICVIGDKDSVLAFKGLGIKIIPFTHPSKIKKVIKELVPQGYMIFLITEREAEAISDFTDSLADQPYPIILPIPNGVTKSGYGLEKVDRNIAKAVGGMQWQKN